jgi:formate-dependent nitrite reductase membrane component NrfD
MFASTSLSQFYEVNTARVLTSMSSNLCCGLNVAQIVNFWHFTASLLPETARNVFGFAAEFVYGAGPIAILIVAPGLILARYSGCCDSVQIGVPFINMAVPGRKLPRENGESNRRRSTKWQPNRARW